MKTNAMWTLFSHLFFSLTGYSLGESKCNLKKNVRTINHPEAILHIIPGKSYKY